MSYQTFQAEKTVCYVEKKVETKFDLDSCLNMIKQSEGLKLKPYKLFGHWTVGYGCLTNDSINSITKEQADSLLKKRFVDGMKSLPKTLSERHRLVLGLFIYGHGIGKYQTSSIKKMVDLKRYDCVPILFLSWCKINGKVNHHLLKGKIHLGKIWKG